MITGKQKETKNNTGLLLVNLGFWIFRFSDVRFSSFLFLQNMFEKYIGEISRNKK